MYGAKARLGNRAISYLVFIGFNLIPPKDREIYSREQGTGNRKQETGLKLRIKQTSKILFSPAEFLES